MSSDEPRQLRSALEGHDREVLLALLSEYGQRWKHGVDQVCSIGVIFIPLSLSGVVVDPGSAVGTHAIALFSTVLIWIWYWIGQSLRSRLDQDWTVYATIESLLLELDPPCVNRGLAELVPRAKSVFSIRRLRLLIAITITVAWFLVTVSNLLAV